MVENKVDDLSKGRTMARSKLRQTQGANISDADIDADGDSQYMKALGRAIDVLLTFRKGDEPLGNSEIAERTGIPTSTVSRITYTFARRGFLNFDSRRRLYELGGEAFALGQVAFTNLDIRRLAAPLLRDLAFRSGFNAGLAIRDRHMMVFTDAFEGEGLVGLRLFAGSRLPIIKTALGRAYLAALSDEECEVVMEELRERVPDRSVLDRELETAKQQLETHGFCVSLGEWAPDVHGLAAPIKTPSGRVYAIDLGGPSYLLPKEDAWQRHGPAVAAVVRDIESQLKTKA